MILEDRWSRSHPDLMEIDRLVFRPSGVVRSDLEKESESTDYGAHRFTALGKHYRFRASRITPKKAGQFVTFWKRIGDGPIEPFDIADDVDVLMVATRAPEAFGYFEFSKSVLTAQKILTTPAGSGKRAFRVYPPWDSPTNVTASKTQRWQSDFFVDLSDRR